MRDSEELIVESGEWKVDSGKNKRSEAQGKMVDFFRRLSALLLSTVHYSLST
jgi:hypothetical protein